MALPRMHFEGFLNQDSFCRITVIDQPCLPWAVELGVVLCVPSTCQG